MTKSKSVVRKAHQSNYKNFNPIIGAKFKLRKKQIKDDAGNNE